MISSLFPANIFNQFFVNVASKLKEPMKSSNFDLLKDFVNSKDTNDVHFNMPLTNCSFVGNYLSSLDVTKATGLDSMGPRLLKTASNILAPRITYHSMLKFMLFFSLVWKQPKVKIKVREKSRECHNHKPQPFPDTKKKRKPTNPNKHKSNKRTKSTKISSLFPKRGNHNAKRTEKHKNKMTQGKT